MPLLQPPAPDLPSSQLSYTDAYRSIVSRVRRGGAAGSGGVVVFVGVDVDGLLASHILSSLFRQDDVPYRLVPIGGYAELAAKRDETLASDELHTLILLSLGSLLNLAEFFNLPPGVHLHIIDAHRPWNLENLFGLNMDVGEDGERTGEENVWVWGDGTESKLDNIRRSWEAIEYEPSDSGSDDESEGESEDEQEDEEGDTEKDDDDQDDEEGENGEGEGSDSRKRRREGSLQPNKRRKDDKPKRLPGIVRDAHLERIDNYYNAGTSYGMSVAETVYLLATVLERADNDLLWLAILAVTHQYVAALIDRENYEAHHDMLLDEVVRLNPERERGIPNPDDRSITKSEELRFVLFRHWNLYDSMLHSGYVAGRMGIWKDRGRKRLQGLLAKMGYSIQQCQQAYAHMDIGLKKDLPLKLEGMAPEYGLVELGYPSFIRHFGFKVSALSAADAVEGLEALLEAARGIRLEVEVEGGRGGGEWFGGTRTWSIGNGDGVNGDSVGGQENGNGNGDGDEGKESTSEQQWHVANFWTAYDACDDIDMLRKSLSLAKSLHRAIIRQGSAILDKGIIRPFRTFRLAAVKEGPDLPLFCHPSPLSRLALWLVDATRDRWAEKELQKQGKKAKSLPFVVACLNEERKTYVVVGVTGAPEFGDVRKNKFGLAFQVAAEESGASYKSDMFDTSVVEVAAADLQPFIEALQLQSA